MFRRKNVHFISDVDKMLKEFDDSHEKSPAQQAEIDKYDEIDQLRDVAEEE